VLPPAEWRGQWRVHRTSRARPDRRNDDRLRGAYVGSGVQEAPQAPDEIRLQNGPPFGGDAAHACRAGRVAPERTRAVLDQGGPGGRV
jgi:hypothetical protein